MKCSGAAVNRNRRLLVKEAALRLRVNRERLTINEERKDSLWLYENDNDDENFV